MSTESDTTGVATWTDEAWRSAALDWALARLGERGLTLTGGPEQPHIRVWSTAFRLPVRGGAVWLKSVGPGSAQEPPLVEALGTWVPEHVLVPLAVHPGRRLMLLPDGGATLRAAGGAGSVEAWTSMLGDYARMQVELVPHAEEMVALGVPDLRPAGLAELVADLVDDAEFLPADGAAGLRNRLREQLGGFRVLCDRLADGGVPASVQHDDLHDANVFVEMSRYRFFDWGDASVAHPFFSLLVPLRVAADELGIPNEDPVLHRLRDAYLEPWSSYGTPAELRDQVELALRVAPLPRALTWRRILRGVHPAERASWPDAVPGWVGRYLEAGPPQPTRTSSGSGVSAARDVSYTAESAAPTLSTTRRTASDDRPHHIGHTL